MNNGQLKGDKVIWIIAIILSVFSLLAVYSSTGSLAYRTQGGNTEFFLIKQFFIVLLGIGLMYAAYRVPYNYFSRIAQFLFYFSIPMLLFAIFFGPEINGARRTIFVPGTGLTFQPSDLAKLALIMYMARFLSKHQEEIQDFKKGFMPILIRIIIITLLILPGSLSTAAIVFVTSMIMLYMGRASFKHLAALVGVGLAAFGLLLMVAFVAPKVLPRAETWKNRIVHFFYPDDEQNNQVLQSKIAVASGGFFGKMPGNSTQRNFLPHPYSDFVYAIIIEEYGMMGGVTIVLMYLILFFRALKIARRCDLKFGSFLVIGISFLLVFQAMINMGVAVNLLPVTGQTLPFVSMGGTSFWFTCLGIGMVLSVSRAVPESQNIPENVNYAAA